MQLALNGLFWNYRDIEAQLTGQEIFVETIGWISTASFLISIVIPQRIKLHELGIFTSFTTGIYAYSHGATAIWVKWVIALFFHIYMWRKLRSQL